MQVDQVDLKTPKGCAALNWLERSRGRLELCLNAVEAILQYSAIVVPSNTIIVLHQSKMVCIWKCGMTLTVHVWHKLNSFSKKNNRVLVLI